jgi:exopolysaccharide production protein ExoQ
MANWSLSARTKILRGLEKCFITLSLFLSSGALLTLLVLHGQDKAETAEAGSPVIQGVWLFINFIAFILILRRGRSFIKFLINDKFLMILIGLVSFSVFWSADPLITLRRCVALFGTTFLGVYIAMRYSIKEWLGLLAWALGLAAVLSLVFAIGLPSYGIDHEFHEGAWQGVFIQKNILGRIMVLAAVVFLILLRNSTALKQKGYWLAAFLIAILLVILSSSVASLLSLILALLILSAAHVCQRSRKWLWFGIISVGLPIFFGATWVLLNIETVLSYFGRDIALSGRIPLWIAALEMAKNKYLIGYGFGAFWTGWGGPCGEVWQAAKWEPTSAHNGFLDIVLHLGVSGLILMISWIFSGFINSIKFIRYSSDSIAVWPFIYLFFMIIVNLPESNLLQQNNVFWILFVTLSLSMKRELKDIVEKCQNIADLH